MSGEQNLREFRIDLARCLKQGLAALRRGDFNAAKESVSWRKCSRARQTAWHLFAACSIVRSRAERSIVEAFLASNIPAAFQAPTFAPDLYPNREALKQVLAMGIPVEGEGQPADFRGGLLLHGPTGSGKTRAAFSLLTNELRQDPDLRFKYVSAPDLKRRLADAARGGKSHLILEELLEETSCILFIDDLSQARFTPAFAENLFELIDRVHRERRPLIVTVQTNGADLVRKWCADDKDLIDSAQAIARRLREYCVAVKFPAVGHPRAEQRAAA